MAVQPPNEWDKENWDDELPPHAGNLGTSLQGLTYDFEKAIADVVDNSISHGQADNIWIIISNGEDDEDTDDPYVSIIDDGVGMSSDSLRLALRYGAESDPNDLNLGRFGLGMKTASTSQCNVLTGCSRDDKTSEFHALTWDLNFLRSGVTHGRWIPLRRDVNTIPKRCLDLVKGSTGTIVHWNDLSKMLPNIESLPTHQIQTALAARIKKTKRHLGMVFHRFIEGKTVHHEDRKINIWINDTLVNPWDPFAKWHQASRHHALDEQDLPLEYEIEDKASGRVSISYFGNVMSINARILPRKDEFFAQSVDGIELNKNQVHTHVGNGKWNESQGIYLYRLDRIIQAGRWSSLLSTDEHTKLARVSIDVGRDWDEILQLNVTKSFVKLPRALCGTKENKKDLRHILSNVRSRAKSVYDNDGTEELISPPGGFPEQRQNSPSPRRPPRITPPNNDPPQETESPGGEAGPAPLPKINPGSISNLQREEFKQELIELCKNEEEADILKRIFSRLQD